MGAWGIDTQWARMLAYITGLVDQELLVRTEYLAAENRILRAQLKGRLRLSDAERATLGEIGHRLGRKALAEVANAALPDTILGWYRKLVARKFDGSKARRGAGRPRTDSELERLIEDRPVVDRGDYCAGRYRYRSEARSTYELHNHLTQRLDHGQPGHER